MVQFKEYLLKYFNPKGFVAAVLIVTVLLTVFGFFELPEEHYVLYDGAVNEETGTLCITGRSGSQSILYIFSGEGECILKYSLAVKTGRAQFNRVWVQDDMFYLFNFKDKTIYSIAEDGDVTKVKKLDSNDYWKQREPWKNWSVSGSVYSFEHNGITYKYDNGNYFSLKFTKKNRELNVVTPDGERYKLWDSSVRNEEFKAFPFQSY